MYRAKLAGALACARNFAQRGFCIFIGLMLQREYLACTLARARNYAQRDSDEEEKQGLMRLFSVM